MSRFTVAQVLLALFAVPALVAQTTAVAQISGVVQDATGLGVPGAAVKVTRPDTGFTRTVETSPEGFYTLNNLQVGAYQLSVTKDGFAGYTQSGIVLQVNTNPTINVSLKVGTVSEQVQVEASSAQVETQSTGVGQVIDNQRVVELPLNGRQATELIFLSGAATPAPAADLNTSKNYPTVTISLGGGAQNTTTYLLDGATHNDPFNNLNLPLPFPDALQEFKVETSSTPARYGHHSAGAVNIVTKSGTNAFHGSMFEFVRNGVFNARNFFALRRDTLKRNQFGGTLGGRIIPNKLFFFAGYQGTITRSDPGTTISFTPTAAMRAGDFSAFAAPACNANRQMTLRAPFTDNRIPVSQLNPVALNILKQVPVSTDPCGRYQYGILNNSGEHMGVVKTDYQISEGHFFFGRYIVANYDNPVDPSSLLTSTKAGVSDRVNSAVLGDTFLIRPTLVNSWRGTFNRARVNRLVAEFFSPTDVGVQTVSPVARYLNMNITGGFGAGGAATNPGFFNTQTIQLADDVDWIHGAHQTAFGFNWIHTRQNELNNQFTNGQYTFNGQLIGLGLADFMTGNMSAFQQGNPQRDNERHNFISMYAQDAWKVKPNLTINAGIRWDPYFPMKHVFGWVSQFDRGRFNAGVRSKVYPNGPAGMLFGGDEGMQPKSVTNPDYANFAPRIGIVWDPRGKGTETIRASYGVFWDVPHLFFNVRYANAPPWGASVSVPNTNLTNPYATYAGGNPFPAAFNLSKDYIFPNFGVYIDHPDNTKATYLQQWNLSLQKQVAGSWLLSASYLGNKTTHLWTAFEANPGIFVTGATTANVNQRRLLNLANPNEGRYYASITTLDDGGTANYNAMLLSVNRRFSSGVTLLANYTLSHCISDPITTEIAGSSYPENGNRRGSRGNCGGSDRRHLFNSSAVVQTPKFANAWTNRLVSGWQVSGIFRAQSGTFTTITTGVDNALSGVGGQRPDQIGEWRPATQSVDRWIVASAFAAPTGGRYGNIATNNILGPGFLTVDFGLVRNFKFRESHQIQARAEAFNAINRLNANLPTTGLNNGLFGTITTAQDPRILQFALKYSF